MSTTKWIVLVVILVPVAAFALYEYKLQSARSDMRNAIESSREKNLEVQAALNESIGN